VPLLSVNLNYVAAMREMRRLGEPDPAQAAVLAELAGADGIAIQLRRDRKNIRDRDLYLLKGVVKTRLTVEMPPTEEMIEKALEVKPWMVTFVADHADSNAPVSAIDFKSVSVDFSDLTNRFNGVGTSVCFMVEPDSEDIRGAAKAGANAVLITGAGYTEARTLEDAQAELDRIDRAAQAANKAGMSVYCGRGIGYKNAMPLVELGNIDEFVIGYAISSKAILVGFERAVREMVSVLRGAAVSAE